MSLGIPNCADCGSSDDFNDCSCANIPVAVPQHTGVCNISPGLNTEPDAANVDFFVETRSSCVKYAGWATGHVQAPYRRHFGAFWNKPRSEFQALYSSEIERARKVSGLEHNVPIEQCVAYPVRLHIVPSKHTGPIDMQFH